MKALVREPGETITEDMNIPCIDWKSGAPLTNQRWFGGPYTFIENYTPKVEDDLEFINELHEQLVEEEDHVNAETVTINGKEYTVEEAREILGVKL